MTSLNNQKGDKLGFWYFLDLLDVEFYGFFDGIECRRGMGRGWGLFGDGLGWFGGKPPPWAIFGEVKAEGERDDQGDNLGGFWGCMGLFQTLLRRTKIICSQLPYIA